MHRSLRFSIISVIMTVMIITIITLTYTTYKKLNNDIVEKNTEAFNSFMRIFNTEKELEINKYSMALDVLLDNPHVTAAFAERDRHSLSSLTENLFKSKLKPLYGINQFQFHLPNATSFFRVHMPEKYGDNLSSFRKTVVKANRYKTMIPGLETGRDGLGLRVVKPVWNNFDYVGTVEFGGNIENILDAAKNSTNIDYAIGLKESVMANAHTITKPKGWQTHRGLFIYDFSTNTLRSLVHQGMNHKNEKIFKYNNKFYILDSMPLLDYSSDNIGDIILLKDVSTDVAAMHQEIIKQGVIITCSGVLIAVIISFVLFTLIFSPLRKITNHINNNEITADNEPTLLNLPSDGSEISMMAQAFDAMSKKMHDYLLQIKTQIEQINAINQTLEDKVAERTKEMEITNQKLNLALENYININEAKSEFLADMSHEIRSPMNSVLGLSYLAMQTGLNAKQYEYINKINKSASLMLEIINDILDFSKIEAGKLELENVCFNLPEILNNVKDMLEIQAEKKKISFNMHQANNMPEYIKGDPLRLTQILNNLCANAVKFTDHGSVDVYVDVLDSDMAYTNLKFTVKDTGIGIQRDKIGSLFESYAQASSSTSRKYGGSGLGLNITKKILDKMGGSIFVESVPDKGSTFWFTLRLKNADLISSENFAEKGTLLKGKRILVAEKYFSDPGSISSIFRQLMADVVSVDNRIELLKTLSSNVSNENKLSFDLVVLEILLDCNTPIAGLESLSQSIEGLVLPHIINISTDVQDSPLSNLITTLEKPVSAETILKTVSMLISDVQEPENLQVITIASSHCKLLIVDDNSLNREILAGYTSLLGVESDFAVNGLEAVKKAEKEKYDLFFIDAKMPDLTGYKTAEMIKQININADAPIYIMSAKIHSEQDISQYNGIINGFVNKPLNMPEISHIIAKSTDNGKLDKKHILSAEADGHVDVDKGLLNFGNNEALYKKALGDLLEFITNLNTQVSSDQHMKKEEITYTLNQVLSFAENLALPRLHLLVENALNSRKEQTNIYSEASLILCMEELSKIRTILTNDLQ